MKLAILIMILFFQVSFLSAQYGEQQIISDTSPFPSRSIPFDIDDDGFMDVFTTSDHKLKWFRNLDGLGNFSDEIIISNNTAFYIYIDFVDFDLDGDKDLVYLENNPRKLEWLENLDGEGNFGTVQIILENQPDYISSFKVIDLDNDSDLDLVIKYTNTFTDRIVWLENLDGLGNFSDENILLEGLYEVSTPLFVDIDNDGNLDILTSHEIDGPARLVWYKNFGNVNFGTEQIIYQFEYAQSDWTSIYNIMFIDISSDGLDDIIITTNHDDIGVFVRWLKNIDGAGNFEPYQNLSNALGTSFYDFYDLDNDGDQDLLGGTRFGDVFYWLENEDGLGNFSERNIISTEIDFIKDAKAADFNGDGFLDVVSASGGDDKVAWYAYEELGIEELATNKLTLYPNPTNDFVQIQSSQQITQVDIYNVLGKKVKTIINQKLINVSDLVSGIYLLQIKGENDFSEIHKLIKK